MSEKQYDASSIQVLEGLEAVRKRPGMYIGSTDARGLHHCVWEILDNAIDEAINGHGNTIKVTIHKDDSVSIEDEGRGMPVGMHAKGISSLAVIFTVLHAGGKFSEAGGYKTSGGLHGVGASVVNALSRKVVVEVKDGKQIYQMEFSDGGKNISPLEVIGKTNKTGSTVRFWPDNRIFSTTQFSYTTISERARESAFLLNELKIIVADERKDKKEEFHYENGLAAFMEYLHEDRTCFHPPVTFGGEEKEIKVDFAFQYTDDYQETMFSFVNMVRTKDGGTHEVGARAAFT
ncbi:MAG: ATP-binding protein, partial [Erysipelotrichaceae bacterium]